MYEIFWAEPRLPATPTTANPPATITKTRTQIQIFASDLMPHSITIGNNGILYSESKFCSSRPALQTSVRMLRHLSFRSVIHAQLHF